MDEKIERIMADLITTKSQISNTLDHNYWSERESIIKNLNNAISGLRWIEILREEKGV